MKQKHVLFYIIIGVVSFFYFEKAIVSSSRCGRRHYIRSTTEPTDTSYEEEEYDYYDLEQLNLTMNVKVYFDVPRALQLGTNIKYSLRAYAKTLVDRTEKYLRHPSWPFPVVINMLGVRFIQSLTNMQYHVADSMEILRDFCMWRRINKEMFSDVWVFNILLTELDLKFTDDMNVTTDSAGACVESGYCIAYWNCAVVEYNKEPFVSAVMLAHELGHSLGAIHDENTECNGEYSIMSSRIKATDSLPQNWSNCSRRYIEKFLLQEKSSCLGGDDFRAILSQSHQTNETATISQVYNVNLTRINEIFNISSN